MDIKSEIVAIANKIISHFSAEEVVQARLLDGTMVEWSGTLRKGTKMYVLGSEGKEPAKSGEYELENGDIVKIEAGSVFDVLLKQHEEMNNFNPEEFEAAFSAKLDEKLAVLEAKQVEVEAKFAEIEAKIAETKSAEVASVIQAVEELKSEIANFSVEKPTKETKTEFSEQGKYTSILNSIKRK